MLRDVGNGVWMEVGARVAVGQGVAGVPTCFIPTVAVAAAADVRLSGAVVLGVPAASIVRIIRLKTQGFFRVPQRLEAGLSTAALWEKLLKNEEKIKH